MARGQPARLPPLLRDRPFRRYWSGQTISLFGDQVSAIALPLIAVLVLHASAAEMGYLGALVWVPSLLFAVHAGAWVDRRGRRRTTIGIGWAYVVGCLVFTAPLLLVPVASGPPAVVLVMLFAAEFASGFGVMILDISIVAIFAAVIPDQLRSRVSGASQAVNYGTRPVGALAGGTLGTLIGLRPALWIGAASAITGGL